MSAEDEPRLLRVAVAFQESADSMVAAAATLGENQCLEDDPGSLSAGGCALAAVGRSMASVAGAL
eukprot:3086820-Prymnesium_polylepis.1